MLYCLQSTGPADDFALFAQVDGARQPTALCGHGILYFTEIILYYYVRHWYIVTAPTLYTD